MASTGKGVSSTLAAGEAAKQRRKSRDLDGSTAPSRRRSSASIIASVAEHAVEGSSTSLIPPSPSKRVPPRRSSRGSVIEPWQRTDKASSVASGSASVAKPSVSRRSSGILLVDVPTRPEPRVSRIPDRNWGSEGSTSSHDGVLHSFEDTESLRGSPDKLDTKRYSYDMRSPNSPHEAVYSIQAAADLRERGHLDGEEFTMLKTAILTPPKQVSPPFVRYSQSPSPRRSSPLKSPRTPNAWNEFAYGSQSSYSFDHQRIQSAVTPPSPAEFPRYNVHVSVAGERLGFSVVFCDGRTQIQRIRRNSVLYRDGQVHIGDTVLKVNGLTIRTAEDIKPIFRSCFESGKLHMAMERTAFRPTLPTEQGESEYITIADTDTEWLTSETDTVDVTLRRGEIPLGVSIAAVKNSISGKSKLLLSQVEKQGTTGRDIGLRVGDEICSINGCPVNAKNPPALASLLMSSVLNLKIKRHAPTDDVVVL